MMTQSIKSLKENKVKIFYKEISNTALLFNNNYQGKVSKS